MKVEVCFDPEGAKRGDRAQDDGRRATKAPVNRQARQLALAYHIEALIAIGAMKDIAHVSRVAGVSRARVSQLLDMTLLAPWVQESVLDGSCALGTHELRRLTGVPDWRLQNDGKL